MKKHLFWFLPFLLLIPIGLYSYSVFGSKYITTFGWKEYKNSTFQYSFKYPPSWKLDLTHADPSNETNKKEFSYSQGSEIILRSPEDYIFRFGYNILDLNNIAVYPVLKSESIIIDKFPMQKTLLGCAPLEKAFNKCMENTFQRIAYNYGTSALKSDMIVSYLTLSQKNFKTFIGTNHKPIIIEFLLPKYLSISDTSHKYMETVFDAIATSIVFPPSEKQ